MTTIRGAITIENNVAEEIIAATESLLQTIFDKNEIEIDNIVFIVFTATKDIDKAYPAVAARKMGVVDASLMCLQEMCVEGSLPMCIRVMVAINGGKPQKDVCHCYMKNAGVLRPDLKHSTVAIDGPVASGKSSISREAANRLSLKHIETGAMYRAVALHCMRKGITGREAIIDELDKFQLTVQFTDKGQRVYLDGDDVTDDLRTQEIAGAASSYAAIGEVRQKLVPLQRSLAENDDVIMDGRDIQTVVLPDADVKLFITASVDERTKRRCVDLEKKGEQCSFETVKRQIMERDSVDSGRADSPLLKSEDAVEIDTTELTFEESVEKVVGVIQEKLNRRV